MAQRTPAATVMKVWWQDQLRYRSIWSLMIGLFYLNFTIYFFLIWYPSYLMQARLLAGCAGHAARPS